MARIGAVAHIVDLKIGLFLGKFRVDGVVGPNKVTVLGAREIDIFEAQLKARNFVCITVGNEPVVGVAAIIAFFHDAREIVDGGGILHGFASADELRNAVGIESVELADGGFGD